ncbi:hypothetical protein MMC28_011518 [Mycoblastus sanguinarius]|nr:hypothetical protein [Mycoblastus sanguinarius]
MTYIATSRTFIIDDKTLTPGGAITVFRTLILLAATGVYAVIGTSTISLTTTSPTLITSTGTTYTATSETFVIDGTTLTLGSAITVADTRLSLRLFQSSAPAYVVVDISTFSFGVPNRLTIGGHIYTANSLSDFIINRQTLTPGGVITVGGTPVSLSPDSKNAIVGSSTEGLRGYIIEGFGGRIPSGGGNSIGGPNDSVIPFLGRAARQR